MTAERDHPSGQASSRHIVGLDGLRALAVIAVIAYHLAPSVVPGGFVGVDVFFVISGFLITTILLDERSQTGKIDLPRFWLRRARRLLPALLATICLVSSVALFVRGDSMVGLGRQALGAATFSSNWMEVAAGANYFDASNPHLFTNFWSLAVEEQFYALWPFVLVLLLSLPLLSQRFRTGARLCLVLAFASALLMALLFHGDNATRVYYGADTHIFGLMLGAALAFWGHGRSLQGADRCRGFLAHPAAITGVGVLALGALLALMVMLSDHATLTYRGGLVLASLCSLVLMFATITSRNVLSRIFNARPLVWIGVRSYGIYLWHWPVLVLLRSILPAAEPWLIAVVTCALTLACAALSYRFLEMPIRSFGFRAFIARGIRRETVIVNNVMTGWRVRPHPIALLCVVAVGLTVAAIITAPTKTQAQQHIEAGQAAIKAAASHPYTSPHAVAGRDVTLIGDSVSLAAAPTVEKRLPGIAIDAKISRSMRRGGLETLEKLQAAGKLRPVVIVALGTNGFYGTGNLERMVAELGSKHQIILVTAHGHEVWTQGNNQYARATARKYPNVHIAEWDQAISAHPKELSADGVHPATTAGETIYANCLAAALAQTRLQK